MAAQTETLVPTTEETQAELYAQREVPHTVLPDPTSASGLNLIQNFVSFLASRKEVALQNGWNFHKAFSEFLADTNILDQYPALKDSTEGSGYARETYLANAVFDFCGINSFDALLENAELIAEDLGMIVTSVRRAEGQLGSSDIPASVIEKIKQEELGRSAANAHSYQEAMDAYAVFKQRQKAREFVESVVPTLVQQQHEQHVFQQKEAIKAQVLATLDLHEPLPAGVADAIDSFCEQFLANTDTITPETARQIVYQLQLGTPYAAAYQEFSNFLADRNKTFEPETVAAAIAVKSNEVTQTSGIGKLNQYSVALNQLHRVINGSSQLGSSASPTRTLNRVGNLEGAAIGRYQEQGVYHAIQNKILQRLDSMRQAGAITQEQYNTIAQSSKIKELSYRYSSALSQASVYPPNQDLDKMLNEKVFRGIGDSLGLSQQQIEENFSGLVDTKTHKTARLYYLMTTPQGTTPEGQQELAVLSNELHTTAQQQVSQYTNIDQTQFTEEQQRRFASARDDAMLYGSIASVAATDPQLPAAFLNAPETVETYGATFPGELFSTILDNPNLSHPEDIPTENIPIPEPAPSAAVPPVQKAPAGQDTSMAQGITANQGIASTPPSPTTMTPSQEWSVVRDLTQAIEEGGPIGDGAVYITSSVLATELELLFKHNPALLREAPVLGTAYQALTVYQNEHQSAFIKLLQKELWKRYQKRLLGSASSGSEGLFGRFGLKPVPVNNIPGRDRFEEELTRKLFDLSQKDPEAFRKLYLKSLNKWLRTQRYNASKEVLQTFFKKNKFLIDLLGKTSVEDMPVKLAKHFGLKLGRKLGKWQYSATKKSFVFVKDATVRKWYGYKMFGKLSETEQTELMYAKMFDKLGRREFYSRTGKFVGQKTGYSRLAELYQRFSAPVKDRLGAIKTGAQNRTKLLKAAVSKWYKNSPSKAARFARLLGKTGVLLKKGVVLVLGKVLAAATVVGNLLLAIKLLKPMFSLVKKVTAMVIAYLYMLLMWLMNYIWALMGAIVGAAVGLVAGAIVGAIAGYIIGGAIGGFLCLGFALCVVVGSWLGGMVGGWLGGLIGSAIGATIGGLLGYAFQHLILGHGVGGGIGATAGFVVGDPLGAIGGAYIGAAVEWFIREILWDKIALNFELALSNLLHWLVNAAWNFISGVGHFLSGLFHAVFGGGGVSALTTFMMTLGPVGIIVGGGILIGTLIVPILIPGSGSQPNVPDLKLTGSAKVSSGAPIDYQLSANVISCSTSVTIDAPLNQVTLAELQDPSLKTGGVFKSITAISSADKLTWKIELTRPTCPAGSGSSSSPAPSGGASISSILNVAAPINSYALTTDFCQGANPAGCSTALKNIYETAGTWANMPAAVIAGISNQEWKATFKHTDTEIVQWSKEGERVEPNGPTEHPRFINGCALSFAYAEGPMQFLTGKNGGLNVWNSYRTAAIEAGVRKSGYTGEACNVLDAIFGAAKKLKSNSGVPFAVHKPEWQKDDVYNAARAYLGACIPNYNPNINYCEGVWQYYRAFTPKAL